MTLDVDQVLARYHRQVVDRQHSVVNLLLHDVGLRRSLDRHLRVSCIHANFKSNQSLLLAP